MHTLRRLVASLGAAMALGLAMTGVTLAADPVDVDVPGVLDGDAQAELDLLAGADADADDDAAATLDADADADVDMATDTRATLRGATHARRAVDADVDGDVDSDVEADVDADVDAAIGDADPEDTRVTGFMGLDVCARLALLGKTGPCDGDAAAGPSGDGDAALDADATLGADGALDAALIDEDGVTGADDGTLAAAGAADACARLAIFGDAGSCAGDSAPGGGSPDADDNVVEAVAKLATAADATAGTDEGTAADAALDACASVALFGDGSACGPASAPDDGETGPDEGGTGPGTDVPGTASDDIGSGTAPGEITRPDTAAGDGHRESSLPDTASMLLGDPFVPLAVFFALLAGSALLGRVRGGAMS
jgi:hypothetical protein